MDTKIDCSPGDVMPMGVSILTSKGGPPGKKSVVAKITSEVADGQATSGSKTVPAASWVHTRNDCSRVHASAPTLEQTPGGRAGLFE